MGLEVECPLTENRQREAGRQIAESQLSELQNTRVLLEEARGPSRNLAYHRRARLEATIGGALDKVHRQIVDDRPRRYPYGQRPLPGSRASVARGRLLRSSGAAAPEAAILTRKTFGRPCANAYPARQDEPVSVG